MPSADGGCLCGAVRYRITGAPSSSVICHCRSCRLASGAATVAWLTVERPQFAWLAGEPRAFHSSPGVVRRFCGTCGSPLTYETAQSPSRIDVTTASLDEPERYPPTEEVWTLHRIAWQRVDPELRQTASSSA